jgi:hypothetical protein
MARGRRIHYPLARVRLWYSRARQRDPSPGGDQVHGFSISSKGYIGTGFTAISNGIVHKDFWEYDPVDVDSVGLLFRRGFEPLEFERPLLAADGTRLPRRLAPNSSLSAYCQLSPLEIINLRFVHSAFARTGSGKVFSGSSPILRHFVAAAQKVCRSEAAFAALDRVSSRIIRRLKA